MAAPYASGYHVVAIITPNPGKIDRVLEELEKYSNYCLENESGTIKYEVSRGYPAAIAASSAAGETSIAEHEEIYISEIYQDEPAHGVHMTSSALGELFKLSDAEQLLAKAPDIRLTRVVGGFDRTKK